ncbi:cytospin-A-like isoform X2 [Phoenix dactylifera]|uniref:Cytospin-A-like isoform X2 n=1 Tax=Phoenix dactylifera TaxID=42345 RepID=A0A8B7BN56_PHODC|nr:cytospin-A-like isoform X2 [Phoenix dactylifera]
MGGHESSPPSSSDRRQWQRIFGTLVEMLQSQQSQIETLADDRKFLERYIHIQNDRWASKTRILESHIVQMKKEERKGRRVQAAKLDLMVGMKEREALCSKKQYELAESDLEDFRACVETLGAEISELKLRSREIDNGGTGVSDTKTRENAKEEQRSTTVLEGELRKLKHAYKRLSSKKEAEVSALLAEKDFVWNQLKNMESDYAGLLKIKRTEIQQANEAMEKLLHDLARLQSSDNEKDGTIARLEDERARLELGLRRQTQEAEQANAKLEQLQHDMEQLQILAKEKDETITKLRSDLAKIEMDATKSTNRKSRFFKDMNTQRNSRNASVTPVRSCLRRSSRKRNLESARGHASQKRRRTNEDSSGSQVASSVNGIRQCSRGRQTRTVSPVDSPRLFSANFKVPKLKSSSPAIV